MASSTKRDKEKSQPIQVFVRSRPLSKQEVETHSNNCIEILNSKELAIRQQYGKRYSFDKVFASNVSQLDVYSNVVKPLISEVLAGYNCTVFAYGQTGTGKTYTMVGGSVFSAGTSWQDDLEAGIIPRALSHLFDNLHLLQKQYTVLVSYLELYNEDLFDLLSDNVESKGIRLFEDQHQKGSVIISGITKETVHNKHEVYEILQRGQERRRSAATLINAQSSRSHTVFSIMVHTCETTFEGEELVKTGKLNLVDLAGSENIGKSGAIDIRAREAGNINQSLLTLGRVIKALVERSAHIPYRESKLTRILQDSLGGRTKTSIIATISPAISCLEETLSTLDYANRARNITNRPEINQRVCQKAWKAQYEKELERLRKDLQAASTGDGITLHKENYDRMIYESDNCKKELAEKIGIVRDLEQQITNMEQQKQLQIVEWDQMQHSFELTRNKLVEYRNKLKETTRQKQEQELLATFYETKAERLHGQAQLLFEMAQQAAMSFSKKMNNLCSASKQNNDSIKKLSKKVIGKCEGITNELIAFMISVKDSSEQASNLVTTMKKQHIKNYEAAEQYQNNVIGEAGKLVSVVYTDLKNACYIEHSQEEKFLDKIQKKLDDVHEMTQWIDLKIDLQNIREDIFSDLEDAKSNITKQVDVQEEIEYKIKDIGENMVDMHRSVGSLIDRLQILECKVSQSRNLNQNCIRKLHNTEINLYSRIRKVENGLQTNVDQVSTSLTETADIIEQHKLRDIAVEKALQQLEICKKDFEQTEIAPKHTMEVYVQNLNSLTRNHMKTTQKSLYGLTSISNLILSKLSQLKEITSQYTITTTSALEECQESLTNFIDNTLTDVNSREGTPCRVQFDPTTLTQASPRERILMRFRDQFEELSLNERLEFEEEDVSPLGSLEEDSPIPLHVLNSNVVRAQQTGLKEKPPEYDKENAPRTENRDTT